MKNILNNDEVKNIIEKNEGYYSIIELNDVLYLNNKLYTKIECLQNLHNLKTLYLNNNALEKIEGLDCCINLIALYLNCNQIKKIENLNNLIRLRILNLEDNNIFVIENLECLDCLEDLNLSNNCLGSKGSPNTSILHKNKNIYILNLSNNQINEDILDNLLMLKNLSILYLMNNPILLKYNNYRKLFIYKLKRLTYLDYKPIKTDERRCIEAFFEGGPLKEQEVMQKIERQKKLQHRNSIECIISIKKIILKKYMK